MRADILLVEDDANDQLFFRRALQNDEQEVALAVVEDGDEALDYLKGNPRPRIIVTDLHLSRMDGKALLKSLKEQPATRPIPVIIFTTTDAEDEIRECYQGFANAYVVKPDSPKEYVAVVRSLVDFWLGWSRSGS